MIKKPISIDCGEYPSELSVYLKNAKIYDSSCSPEARVIFIDRDGGYYLKTAKKGSLEREAELTAYFADKKLSARVLEYVSGDKDYLITEAISGEDCTYYKYLEQPERLCDTLAELLRKLHGEDFDGCPVLNHGERYLKTVRDNYKNGIFDPSFMDEGLGLTDKEAAFKYIDERKKLLSGKVLLHGDYCLPNVLLDDFKFSGFIDVGNGGVGDRHVDLFWGAWTLNYNLKTDKYRERFFDAYGRELVDRELIKLVSVMECFG